MASSKKIPELRDDVVTNERVKNVIRKIKHVSDGYVYVYQWNISDQSKNPPLGLVISPEHVKTACDAVTEYGGKRTDKSDAVQFDMTDACGIPGNHLVLYKSGKIIVTATERGSKNTDIPSKFDFHTTVLIDIIDVISKSIKGFEIEKRRVAKPKNPASEQCKANEKSPVNNFSVILKNLIPSEIKIK